MLPAQLEALPSCAASILEDGRAALARGGGDLIAGVGLDFMVAERRACLTPENPIRDTTLGSA